MLKQVIGTVALLAVAGSASAQVDGLLTTAKGYGAPVFTQTVQTGFGTPPNGSEISAIYCRQEGANLRMLITGSIEANFNKLSLFFGTGAAGGQNVINGANNPTNDGWASKYNGFTFDSGFSANYHLVFRRSGSAFDVDFARVGGAAGDGGRVGVGSIPTGTPNNVSISSVIGSLGNIALTVGYTTTSTSIGGGNGSAVNLADALAANAGLEFTIPYAALGLAPGQSFLLSANIGNGDYNYLSNQFAGGLPVGQSNLGSDGNGGFVSSGYSAINLNNYAGDQFILVPAPSSMALMGLGGLLAARRRRA